MCHHMVDKGYGQVLTNHVVLQGRVGEGLNERVLPSGDRVVSFKVIVDRSPSDTGGKASDMIDCVALSTGLRRKALRLAPGIRVDLEGALRRRFFRAGGALVSRYEVEIHSLTRVQG
jgi:single-strand DNA-binding protein